MHMSMHVSIWNKSASFKTFPQVLRKRRGGVHSSVHVLITGFSHSLSKQIPGCYLLFLKGTVQYWLEAHPQINAHPSFLWGYIHCLEQECGPDPAISTWSDDMMEWDMHLPVPFISSSAFHTYITRMYTRNFLCNFHIALLVESSIWKWQRKFQALKIVGLSAYALCSASLISATRAVYGNTFRWL